MDKHNKATSFERPSLTRLSLSPARNPKAKNRLIGCLLAAILGALVSLFMNYPFDCFRFENSEEYQLYRQARQEYQAYEVAHRQRPKGLEYISPGLRSRVDRKCSCLVSRNNGKELVVLTYYPDPQNRDRGAAQYLRTFFSAPHIVMAVIPESQVSSKDRECPGSTEK